MCADIIVSPKKFKGLKTKQDFTVYFDKTLGKGSLGSVYKGRDSSGKDIAVKEVKAGDDANILGLMERLVTTLASEKVGTDAFPMLEHPNIVEIIDAVREEKTFYVIQEFCEGTLENLMKERAGNWKEEEFLKVVLEIANGLYFIHAKGFMHKNVKPSNILIKEGILKISDLGLIPENSKTIKTGTAFKKYIAPEIVGHKKFQKESDIYSLGVVCYEMMGDAKFSMKIVQLVIEMISDIPSKRPSIKLIMLKVKLLLTNDKAEKLYLEDQINCLARDEEAGEIRIKEEKVRKEEIAAEVERLFNIKKAEIISEVENKAKLKLAEEEKVSHSPSKDAAKDTAAKKKGTEMKCFGCNEIGHYANQCPKTGGYESKVTCYTCGEKGHYAPQCPKKAK